MRENLIPEQRTDKNGVLSTKWVKSPTAGNVNVSSLPAPVVAAPAPVNHRQEITDILRETAIEMEDDHTQFMSTASDYILGYIHESLLDETKPDYFKGEVSCLMSDNTEERVVEAYIHLHEFHDGKLDDMDGVSLLRGAMDSGSNPIEKYDRNDPKMAEAVKSMFRFIHETDPAVYAQDKEIKGVTNNNLLPATSTRIYDKKIADHITKHPEHIDWIIDVANDHPTDLNEILEAADRHPDRAKEVADLFINYPERVAGRSDGDLTAVLNESKSWSPVSEGIL